MKKSSLDMCTRRATDFAPTPSTLLLLLLSNLPRMKSSSRGLPTYHECTVVYPGVYLLTTNEMNNSSKGLRSYPQVIYHTQTPMLSSVKET